MNPRRRDRAGSANSRNAAHPKIFGLGLTKTGTSSLGAALNRLGITTIHYPHDAHTWATLQEGCFRLGVLDRYQAIVDITVAPFYKELDQAWPGSRFILTVREKSSWLKSIERHWPLMHEWARQSPQFDRFTRFIVARVYGTWDFDAELLSAAYDRHVAAVRQFFRERPEDLLEFDVCNGDGWQKLCRFLDCPAPETEFPHSNPTGSKEAGARWIRRLANARSELCSVIPAGERILLVDNSQLAGCGFDEGLTTSPLIERGGVDWGPPADSAEALAALEHHRRNGARYLVVAWPAFWWFDDYRRFNNFLRTECRCLLDNSRLVVFDLAVESEIPAT